MRLPVHTPYKNGKGGVKIGLEPINDSNWIEIDDLFESEIEEKKRLYESYFEEVYKEVSESSTELDVEDKKPSYMALKQDECNATVEVTEKTGLEVVNTEFFDVNVCKKEIYKIIN